MEPLLQCLLLGKLVFLLPFISGSKYLQPAKSSNSLDPGQTASDLGMRCSVRSVDPYIWIFIENIMFEFLYRKKSFHDEKATLSH